MDIFLTIILHFTYLLETKLNSVLSGINDGPDKDEYKIRAISLELPSEITCIIH